MNKYITTSYIAASYGVKLQQLFKFSMLSIKSAVTVNEFMAMDGPHFLCLYTITHAQCNYV